jgi:hypothetical protein
VFADEVPGGLPVKISDVTNLGNIQVLSTVSQFVQTTPHNPFVPDNQHAFISSYQDGLQLYDISAPATPSLAGFFDTYPQAGGNNNSWPSGGTYNGQWGCYPFFPSGNIFALDRNNGGFILSTAHYKAPYIVISVNSLTTICAGKSMSVSVTNAGAATHSITCTNCAVGNATLLNTAVTFTAGGLNTISVTAVNGAFTVVSTRTVLVQQVTAALSVTNSGCASCANGALGVTPAGGTAPYSYTWVPGPFSNPTISNLLPGCYTVTVKDANGCVSSATACVINGNKASITEAGTDDLHVFPNPACDRIMISSAGKLNYILLNTLGEIVATGSKGPDTKEIDVMTLPAGIYQLVTDGGSRLQTHKIAITPGK